MLDVRVARFNAGPYRHGALAFFDVAIGDVDEEGTFTGVFDVKGLVLKRKLDESGYYYQAPGKLRKDASGNPAKDDQGRTIYDRYFDLHVTYDGKKGAIAPAAWDMRERIIEQAAEQWEQSQAESTGRGADEKPKKAGAAVTEGPEAADPFADEDDDMPF